jgi:hypothetical protein
VRDRRLRRRCAATASGALPWPSARVDLLHPPRSVHLMPPLAKAHGRTRSKSGRRRKRSRRRLTNDAPPARILHRAANPERRSTPRANSSCTALFIEELRGRALASMCARQSLVQTCIAMRAERRPPTILNSTLRKPLAEWDFRHLGGFALRSRVDLLRRPPRRPSAGAPILSHREKNVPSEDQEARSRRNTLRSSSTAEVNRSATAQFTSAE